MKAYELIFFVDPALGEEKIGQLIAKIENKIKSLGGEVEKTEKWGVKRLSSMIKKARKLTQGFYVFICFKGKSSLPNELRAFLRVSEEVVRSFVACAEETAPQTKERIEGVPLSAEQIALPSQEEARLGKS